MMPHELTAVGSLSHTRTHTHTPPPCTLRLRRNQPITVRDKRMLLEPKGGITVYIIHGPLHTMSRVWLCVRVGVCCVLCVCVCVCVLGDGVVLLQDV